MNISLLKKTSEQHLKEQNKRGHSAHSATLLKRWEHTPSRFGHLDENYTLKNYIPPSHGTI